ncbi:hypothetical protein ACTD5D_05730 [Nocardia takedensis]|uniref:hypothetical protein n=1 Tax=Nocardia takedensis TaxID=259390 RepID=UPI000594D6FF|nr:hypothetical protein [Nocardia takedensis]
MKVLATAAVVVAAGLTLRACGDDTTTTPISATSTAQLSAQQSGMATRIPKRAPSPNGPWI